MSNIFFNNTTNSEDIRFASQVVGYIGGALVIGYNLPQLIKMIRTKSTDDVSLLSLIFQFVLNIIYIVYGVLIGELPIIGSEIVAGVICITMMILKRVYDKPKKIAEKKVRNNNNESEGKLEEDIEK